MREIELSGKWIYRPTPRPGARLQLVCFSHAGGGAFSFGAWTANLREDVELLAVQLPGRENRHRESPLSDPGSVVDAVAAALSEVIDRPYAIFGHSLGARLGHLVACRLCDTAVRTPVRLFLSAAAPGGPATDPGAEHLSDPELLRRLERLGGTPSGVLDTPEGRSLFLPAIRADFTLAARLPSPDARLNAPFVLLAGADDLSVTLSDIVRWRRYSSCPCPAHVFPGGHFYAQAEPGRLVALINESLDADVARTWADSANIGIG